MNKDWMSASLVNNKLEVKLNKKLIISNIKSFEEESQLAAQDIANTDKKLFISYSGGMDSEFVCNTFLEAGIYFEAVIFRFANNKEFDHALEYCRNNNITLHILELDAKSFVEYAIDELHSIIKSRSIGLYHLLYLLQWAESMGGICITADGSPTVSSFTSSLSRTFSYNERNLIIDVIGAKHPAGFLSYSQELAYYCTVYNDNRIHQQHNKSRLYKMPYREKIDIISNVHFDRYLKYANQVGILNKAYYLGNTKEIHEWHTI